jgi:ribosomal protein S18 acetylase RimI-like enzyme
MTLYLDRSHLNKIMRLIDLFEARFQEIVHENPSVGTLKALARNNKYHSARFVITKSGDVYAADSLHYTHHSMAPFDGAWEVRGYVQYMDDGSYLYRSMQVYSALNKDHPILRTWERGGIQNGNPDQSHLSEHMVQDVLVSRPQIDLFRHTDLTLDDQVQVEKLQDDVDGLVIYKNNQVAAYLLVQHYEGHAWMLEAHTAPSYRRQGLNTLLIDSAVKKYGRVFADMQLTPDSVQALESYVSRTPYKVYRFNTQTGDLWDYNPANPDDQMMPMYDRWVPGVHRPPHSQAGKFVWAFSTEKPRHALLQGYMRNLGEVLRPSDHIAEAWSTNYKRSINCANPKGFSQRTHCAARRLRQSHKPTRSKAVK